MLVPRTQILVPTQDHPTYQLLDLQSPTPNNTHVELLKSSYMY